MKILIKEIKKYFPYILYSTKSKLKGEVAGSYLNYLWWFISPLCTMLIYMFVVCVVFKSKESNFPIFVFIGLILWNYSNGVINSSSKLIKDNKQIINKVYIPKYILLIIKSFVFLFKLFISFIITIILMFIFNISFSLKMFYFIPILITLYLITFGISTIIMHLGVYIDDLGNIVNIALKFIFYFSGIFYDILSRVPSPFNKLLITFNPIAFLISESRNVLIYNKDLNFSLIFIWFVISIIINFIGLKLVHKYENSYSKVVQ